MDLVNGIERVQIDHTLGRFPRKGSHRLAADQVRAMILTWSTHPKIIAYTRQCIALAKLPDRRGYPKGDSIVAALFAAQKRKLAFVRDPLGSEMMATPVALLCLDPDGLCLLGGDCDDQLIALGSCALSAGVPIKLVIRRYRGQLAGHITLSFDKSMSGAGPWQGIDPSVESGEVSRIRPEEEIIMEIGTLATDTDMPFIGLGHPTDDGAGLGDPVKGSLECPRCGSDDFALVARTREDGDPEPVYQCRACTHQIERRTPLPGELARVDAGDELGAGLGDVSGLGATQPVALPDDQAAAWIGYVTALKGRLDESLEGLKQSAQSFADARATLGLPRNDPPSAIENAAPSPVSGYTAEVTQKGTGAWTAAAEKQQGAILQAMSFASQALAEGLAGTRTLTVNPQTGELSIGQLPGDPMRLDVGQDSGGNPIPVMLDPSSGQEVQGLGIAPIIIGIAIVAVAVVAVVGTIKIADAIMDAHHVDLAQKLTDFDTKALQAGATPEQIAAMNTARGQAAKDLAPAPGSGGSTLESIIQWGLLLGGIAAGLAVGFGFARLFPRIGPSGASKARASSPRSSRAYREGRRARASSPEEGTREFHDCTSAEERVLDFLADHHGEEVDEHELGSTRALLDKMHRRGLISWKETRRGSASLRHDIYLTPRGRETLDECGGHPLA